MAPQPKKVRADIEVTCFSIHGVDGIRDAMVINWMYMTHSLLLRLLVQRKCPLMFVIVYTYHL